MRARTDRVVWEEVEGEAILLHLETSLYLRLNESGTLLWRAMVEGPDELSEDRLVEILRTAYRVDQERAASDVAGFLETLETQGLLER